MQVQSYHEPVSKKKNWGEDYSSLLSSYLNQLETSSRHPGDNITFSTKMEGGQKEALSVAVQQACELLENDCMFDNILSENLFDDDAVSSFSLW